MGIHPELVFADLFRYSKEAELVFVDFVRYSKEIDLVFVVFGPTWVTWPYLFTPLNMVI